MDKSFVPVCHGSPNTYFGRISKLLESQEVLRRLVVDIKGVHADTQSFKNLIEDPRLVPLRDKFFQIMSSYRGEPDTQPVLGPPPRPQELYGRFAHGANVIDIGTGNCSKIRKFTGSLKITAVDPELEGYADICITPVKKRLLECHFPGPRIFTSFMSLCQLSKQEVDMVMAHDGLHVVPDHPFLISEGIAVPGEMGVLEVATSGGVYRDNKLEVAGYDVAPGYLLVPSYEECSVSAVFSNSSGTGDDIYIDASPIDVADVNLFDTTWKVDGVSFEVEWHGGQVYMVGRNGTQYIGVTNFREHMALHVEVCEGKAYLLRVCAYKGIVPPHSLNCLRTFVSRVHVHIVALGHSMCLQTPQDWMHGNGACGYPSDGIITRVAERDFYVKLHWTVDFTPHDIQKFCKATKDHGYAVTVSKVEDGLWEYRMEKKKDIVTLVPQRNRKDKSVATKTETAVRMLEQRNLSEIEALTGSPHAF